MPGVKKEEQKTLKEKQAEMKAEIKESKAKSPVVTVSNLREEKEEAPKRQKTGGRQKGTHNRRKRLTDEMVESILKKNKFDPFETQVALAKKLQEDIADAEKKRKYSDKKAYQSMLIQVLRDMTPVVYAKRKAMETTQEVNIQGSPTLTIVTTKEHNVEAALKKAEEDANEENAGDETKDS